MPDQAISTQVTTSAINELDVLRIKNASASATIALQGAHVVEFTPTDEQNLLFVSTAETFKTGNAIRGGIPICWPWFGSHKDGKGQHGLVRTVLWQFEVIADTEYRTDIKFWIELDGNDEGFPHKARAELFVSIGKTLLISLTTTNLDEQPFLISQALHSYFNCQQISDVRIHGLEGACCFDSLTHENKDVPHEFVFDQETDWIVRDSGQPIALTGLGQLPIKLTRMGSGSVVVWNPWVEKSKKLSQFNNLDYLNMFCVETGNVFEDSRLIKPNKNHVILMELSTDSDHEIS